MNDDSVFLESPCPIRSPNLDTNLDESSAASISMLEKTKNLLNKILLQRSTPAIQSSPDITHVEEDSGIENKSFATISPVINESTIETHADEDLVQLVAKYLVEKAIRNARCSSSSVETQQQRNIFNVAKQSDVENYLSSDKFKIEADALKHSTDICLSNMPLVNSFALNIHRIDKDVTRCDRNYWYFMNTDNLQKLKNIVYTFVYLFLGVLF